MADKNNDQILQTRSIPAKPASHSQNNSPRKYTDEDVKSMGRSSVDQQVAAETQSGENADITTAKEGHHHHHHHHDHGLLHGGISSASDLGAFIVRLFKKPYALAYIIVFFMFLCSIVIASPKCIAFVRFFRSFLAPEQYYRFQEFVFMHRTQFTALPMQIALVAVIVILLWIRSAHPGKFNTYFLRMAPALVVALFFSLPLFHLTGVREDRLSCSNNLKEYYSFLRQYANEHDGILPETLDELNIPKTSILSFCSKDHYEYHAAGKKLDTQNPEMLLSDYSGQHAGNYRLMLMSDGSFRVSKYGGDFVEIKTDTDKADDAKDSKPAKAGKYD